MKTQKIKCLILVLLLILVIIGGIIISVGCIFNPETTVSDDESLDEPDTETDDKTKYWQVELNSNESDTENPLVDLDLRLYADFVKDAYGPNTIVTTNGKLYYYLNDERLINTKSFLYLTINITGSLEKTENFTSASYINNDNKNKEELILDIGSFPDGLYHFKVSGYTQKENGWYKHNLSETTFNIYVDKASPTLNLNVPTGDHPNNEFTIKLDKHWPSEDFLLFQSDRIYWKYNGVEKTEPVTKDSFDDFEYQSKTINSSDPSGWYSFVGYDEVDHMSEVLWVYYTA
jgi:hypothetical protein